MASLLRTSWTDPGIIPRATVQEATDTERQIGSHLLHVLLQMMCCLMSWCQAGGGLCSSSMLVLISVVVLHVY